MSSTDTGDETRVDLSPPKKRRLKRHFSAEIKDMVRNAYKVEIIQNPGMPLKDVELRVAERLGIGSRSVRRIISEYNSSGVLLEPKTNQNRTTKWKSLADFEKTAIRRKVHEFFFRNEHPTIEKVLRVVNEDLDLPNFKKSTFHNILKKLNFQYGRRQRNSFLMDRNDIKCWRRNYLTKIRAFRNENKKIYYLDETWVNAGHTKSRVWTDAKIESSRQAFLDGLSTGLKNPSGKGQRIIVCHIGSGTGFLPGGLWTFQSKSTGDYHEEMDGPSFEKWFEATLPKLEENSVVVLDNAPYHSRQLEKIPTAKFNKRDIQQWLTDKNIEFTPDLIKAQLLQIVRQNRKIHEKYIVDETAKAHNITVLRLPPYHCELNPIELIWADVKNYVADKNTTFKIAEVQTLFQEAVSRITSEKWKKCVEHVKQKVEVDMWKLDNIMDDIAPVIVNLQDSSTSPDDSTDE